MLEDNKYMVCRNVRPYKLYIFNFNQSFQYMNMSVYLSAFMYVYTLAKATTFFNNASKYYSDQGFKARNGFI